MKTHTTHARLKSLLRDEDGSTLIEFAFTIPIFLLLIFGAFQVFTALFLFCNASYGSRVGARYASLHSSTAPVVATPSSVQAVVTPLLWTGVLTTPTVATTWQSSNNIGGTVTVTVTMNLPLPIPFTSIQQIPVSSTAQRAIVH